MESVGARLKKTRLEKGLSLEEAHKNTKIHLDILKAMEEDSFINLSPIYVKGFLRIYCKFLGVDPKDYIPNYKEPQGSSWPRPKEEKRAKPLNVSYFNSAIFKTENIKRVLLVVLIIVFVFGLFKLGKIVSSKRSLRAANKTKAAPIAPAAIPKTEKKEEIVKPQQKQPLPAIIRLGIRAKEDCWMQLRADGKVIFQGVLKKGRFESWQATTKMELSLGNAGVVELEVNGKLISNLGRKGQALKNILITKEGLAIKR